MISPASIALIEASPVWRAKRVEVFDLFPNTHHVETVTRFVSRSS